MTVRSLVRHAAKLYRALHVNLNDSRLCPCAFRLSRPSRHAMHSVTAAHDTLRRPERPPAGHQTRLQTVEKSRRGTHSSRRPQRWHGSMGPEDACADGKARPLVSERRRRRPRAARKPITCSRPGTLPRLRHGLSRLIGGHSQVPSVRLDCSNTNIPVLGTPLPRCVH